MTENYQDNIQELEIEGIIGFDGSIVYGLRVHPDGQHVVYPLGNKVTIQNWASKKQDFLAGHTNIVSAIDVSRSGKYIASGQINHIGFKAWVILWDFETRTALTKHEIHKVRVESVAFSHDDSYLLSLGGRDCGSIVVWDIASGQPLCGAQATRGTQGVATIVCSTNRRGACLLTAGDLNLLIWRIDMNARNIIPMDVNLNKLRRNILCLDLDERDEICYCGTTTGDILKIRLNFHHDVEILEPVKRPTIIGCYTRISRRKLAQGVVDLYVNGVRVILRMPNGNLVIGAGNGTMDMVVQTKGKNVTLPVPISIPTTPELEVLKSTNLHHSITSIQIWGKSFLVGTQNCEIFEVDISSFETKLIVTCHISSIYDIAFPYNHSQVFATASKHDVRLWNMATFEELLRIKVPNFSCSTVIFAYDGKSIITAWNDGIIRAFTPLTGRLIYAILNAHNKGVSALAITRNGSTLISGGCEGQVRLWDITPTRQQLMCTLKEHKGPVSAVDINLTDDEAVSASTDGTCIIWDVIRQVRKQILFANTLFMTVKYYPPSGVQILTAGTDRKICYWEVLDGNLVRELDGSPSGAVNSVDISSDGSLFISGGNDQVVLLWKYQEGSRARFGLGHSAVITCVRFSPDGERIISTSASGSIFVWKNPITIRNETATFDDAKESVQESKAEPVVEHVENLITSRSTSTASSASGDACKCRCKPANRKTTKHK